MELNERRILGSIDDDAKGRKDGRDRIGKDWDKGKKFGKAGQGDNVAEKYGRVVRGSWTGFLRESGCDMEGWFSKAGQGGRKYGRVVRGSWTGFLRESGCDMEGWFSKAGQGGRKYGRVVQ